MVWGVQSLMAPQIDDDEGSRRAIKAARESGVARKGDLIAVVSASPGKRAGATDTVRIVRV